jgi:hypothetical protein
MKTDLQTSLEEAIACAKQQTLSLFVKELMVALKRERFQLENLVEALADYTHERPDFEEVTKKLEEAVTEIRRANEIFK